jgi:hypothetical protein
LNGANLEWNVRSSESELYSLRFAGLRRQLYEKP